MSGHSKWHNIQHKKGKTDKARSAMFTKLGRAITVAAQQGGGDIDMNFSLRLAVQKAKTGNMPKDNIERAIKKGTGELKDGVVIQEITYEGFGPQGVGFIVETMTDNSNRTVSEVKHTFSKGGGSLGGPGSVTWQFEHKGVVRFVREKMSEISEWDDVQLELMDAGADDIRESDEGIELVMTSNHLQGVLKVLELRNIEPDDSGLEWMVKDSTDVSDEVREKVERLFDALEELEDVKAVFSSV